MATIDLAEYSYSLTLDSSQYDTNMDNANKQADNMKTKMSSVGGFLKGALVGGLVAAGAAIAGTIIEGVKSAAELENQMSKFQSSTGATTKEVEEIQGLAKELYKTNTNTMEDIVAISAEMVKSLGMTTDEVAKYQQSYMDYAKTTGQAGTDVISAIDDIGDAWGLTAEESAKSLDMLKKSNEEYGTDIGSVQGALSKVAPAAKALGLSLEETNGYMNLFAASGLDANQAITAFTYASKQVESPEQFKEMVAEISAISDPTDRAQKAVELFGAKAGVAMSNIDTTQLNDFIITMDEAGGTVTNASDSFDSSFNVQLELMKKQFSGLAMEIGQKLMPVINSVLQWVSANLPNIVGGVKTAIDAISGVLSPIINVIKTVFGAFTSGESETSTAFTSIQTTISAVIETIKGVIDGFVTLFTTIWDKWGSDIVAFCTTSFQGIMNIIQSAVDWIKNIIDAFIALFSGDWEGFLEAVKNIFKSMWDLIVNIFKSVLNTISGIVKGAFDVIKTVITTIFDGIKNKIADIWDKIKTSVSTAFNNVVDFVKELPGKIWNTFVDVITKIIEWRDNLVAKGLEAAKGLFDSIVNTITELPGKMLEIGKNLVEGIWNGINNAKDWVLDKIRGFGSAILDGIKGIFGINSPSTLMRDEVGKYLAEGIGVGFEDEIDNVNKRIQDSIKTDFNINSNLIGGINDSKAMSDMEKSISKTYTNNSFANPITIKMGDITVNGSADDITINRIRQISREEADKINSKFINDITFNLKPRMMQMLYT